MSTLADPNQYAYLKNPNNSRGRLHTREGTRAAGAVLGHAPAHLLTGCGRAHEHRARFWGGFFLGGVWGC